MASETMVTVVMALCHLTAVSFSQLTKHTNLHHISFGTLPWLCKVRGTNLHRHHHKTRILQTSVEWRRAVTTTDSIEITIEYSNTDTQSTGTHRRSPCPAICLWIIPSVNKGIQSTTDKTPQCIQNSVDHEVQIPFKSVSR